VIDTLISMEINHIRGTSGSRDPHTLGFHPGECSNRVVDRCLGVGSLGETLDEDPAGGLRHRLGADGGIGFE
jgi:hypothetical protein